jgi:hypothetical protein
MAKRYSWRDGKEVVLGETATSAWNRIVDYIVKWLLFGSIAVAPRSAH